MHHVSPIKPSSVVTQTSMLAAGALRHFLRQGLITRLSWGLGGDSPVSASHGVGIEPVPAHAISCADCYELFSWPRTKGSIQIIDSHKQQYLGRVLVSV